MSENSGMYYFGMACLAVASVIRVIAFPDDYSTLVLLWGIVGGVNIFVAVLSGIVGGD